MRNQLTNSSFREEIKKWLSLVQCGYDGEYKFILGNTKLDEKGREPAID
jgi:hypothetical protein